MLPGMDDSERSVRLPTAIFAAPVFGAMACAMALAAAMTCLGDYCQPHTIGLAAVMGTGAGFGVGVPVMFALGLPLHALLRAAGLSSVRAYALAGALPGAVGTKMLMLSTGQTPLESVMALLAIGGATGVVSATLFWWIRRPDLDPPNPATSAA
jgi:hypothetical protein